jgi:carbamoyl-phosphate synthase large subunit
MLRVLVSGAGGPSAVSFMRAIAGDGVELYAGDMNPFASGLYLVPARRRVLLPPGGDPCFVDETLDFCATHRIDVFVPTVDWELMPTSLAQTRFERIGTRVLVADPAALDLALDKLALMKTCAGVCPVPQSAALDDGLDAGAVAAAWGLPLVVKPRRGAGGRGVRVVESVRELSAVSRDSDCLVQEHLRGAEYSVDVLSDADGVVCAVVPRLRLRIDSGIAVAGRTLHHAALDDAARAVARRVGLIYLSNLQFREDAEGTPKLLEVNARCPGTMPLTVASGVNMPRLALDAVLGRALPRNAGAFRDVAMVRTWQEHFLEPDVFDRVERRALAAAD